MSLSKDFIKAYKAGLVCLHPTDTIPGLSFSPFIEKGVDSIYKIKLRHIDKTFVSLVYDLNIALKYWDQLPESWIFLLNNTWPAPLTVIWNANLNTTPKVLISKNKTVAMRSPVFDKSVNWMKDVLKEINSPLPTTSVNISGEPAIIQWEDALNKFKNYSIFFAPNISKTNSGNFTGKPSTIIEIINSNSFKVLRQGSFDISKLIDMKERDQS